jgi:hypothetical protein
MGEPVSRTERVSVRHTLSARFVEIDDPSVEEFEHHGVAVRADAPLSVLDVSPTHKRYIWIGRVQPRR